MIRRLAAGVALSAVAATAVTGCAAAPDETSCGDYLGKSEPQKWSLIKELAKQDGEQIDDAERGDFVLLMDSICEVHRDKSIKDAMHSLGDEPGPTVPAGH